ncbi:MAG: hypothetical protein L3J67_06280 [Hyphomicrobiaceae bacterium]|nr:hypothetical protein [Hyphomicrobiaceae bacterium]
MLGFGNEFWAAIIGAIVGGLISAGLQWLAYREQKKQREEERKNKDTAIAHSLLFKMIGIHTNLYHFNDYLEKPFQSMMKKNHKTHGSLYYL